MQPALAQVSLPDNNTNMQSNGVNIGQGANPVGSDLFDSYNSQLGKTKTVPVKQKTAVPAIHKQQIKPKAINRSKSQPVSADSKKKSPSYNSSSPVNRSKVRRSGLNKNSAHKMLNKVASNVIRRAKNLNSKVSTSDIDNIVKYVSAMNSIMAMKNGKPDKQKMNDIVKGLASIDSSKLASELANMTNSERELNVLQVANRKVGIENLAATIDDVRGDGKGLSKAMRDISSKLRRGYMNAGGKEDKAQLHAAYNIVSKHIKSGEPLKVMKATLAPFTS